MLSKALCSSMRETWRPAGMPGLHRAYLLRCWRDSPSEEGEVVWRFMLVRVGDESEGRGFANLVLLFDFLLSDLYAEEGHLADEEIQRLADRLAETERRG